MIIYKATNKTTGKVYIGKTVGSLGKRITEHFRSTVGLFPRALRKYGRDGFSFEVIETCEVLEGLNEREIYWIDFYGCKCPAGYNLTDGGENPPSQKGRKRSEETKEKLRGKRNALGTHPSEETRRKMAVMKIGNKNALGHKQTDEEKKKRSIAMKGRFLTDEHKKRLSEAARVRVLNCPMPWGMLGIYEKKPEIIKDAQTAHENISKAAKARVLKFPMPYMKGRGKQQLLQRQQLKEVNVS